MSKKLYTGFSAFQIFRTLFFRLAALVGILYSLPHYNENPVVIIVLVAFCSLFIFFIGADQIVVYEDRIIQTTDSLAYLIFRSKDKVVEIENIESAFLSTRPPSSPSDISVAVILSLILPKSNRTGTYIKPIFFNLKNGKTDQILTHIDNSKMQKIVDLVNSLIIATKKI